MSLLITATDRRLRKFWTCLGPRARALAAAALLLPGAARAQQVLLRANVADDTLLNRTGPNRRYFGHLYMGGGLVAGPGAADAPLRHGLASAELQLGGRLKRRITQNVAVVADARYAYLRYAFAQTAAKTFPSPGLHQSETLGLHQIQAEGGLRLNAGRRGNTVGSYLDLLAWGGWVAGTTRTAADDPAPGGPARTTTTDAGLPYLRRWTGGAGARLGFDRYALVARRRFGPVRRPGSGPDLPAWVLGFEIGLF
ncbi:hypothetical protein [Hymenobacter nivis]|uniref:Outer membrane protein beta-barrel domain-containing protein n=1 Tax=Hymenobacter nivis TaxID=1850093 RepID=A0A502GP73_9BACT|nr:hypothetical protein [Hymenobacter nivis]TPG63691.1 hypothetical protein EAH73_16710 [Hymenobacter nivis]